MRSYIPPKVGMRGYLKTLGWVFKLQPKSTAVGRHKESDLCLQNGGVEEHHALIEWCDAEYCYVLSDLNSAHGTYVNDCRIHNTAVRLTHGDELHFGYGGSTYELSVDGPSPLPVLPAHSSAPPFSPVRVWGGSPVTPRPPSRARPGSAGAKRPSQGSPSEPRTSSLRPGSWPGNTGSGPALRNVRKSQSSQTMQHLLQEKEERLLRLGDEVSRLGVFEGESQRKDQVIAGLCDEVSALRHQLAQSQAGPEIKVRLCSLERAINDKKEQIQQLKEQMLELQQGSGELFKQAVTERDLKIASLRGQLEKLKSDSSRSSDLVSGLQRDLTAREKQALKLVAEVDKLRLDIRLRDAQLRTMANKFSQIKENKKHEEELLVRENEVISLKKGVDKLEVSLRDRQREMKQQSTERDSLRHRLEERTRERASLQTEMERARQQHQLLIQREQRAQAELKHTQTQLECMRSQIIKAVYTTSDLSTAQDTVSDQQLMEQMRELLGQTEVLKSREQELEERLREGGLERDRQAEETHKLKARLEECQSRVQEACTADTLQREMSALQEESVCAGLSWVPTVVLFMLDTLHSLLQDTAQGLHDAGIPVSNSTQGVPGAIRVLAQLHQECRAELKCLKTEIQELEERQTQAADLQAKLSSVRGELEQKSQQESRLQLQLEEVTAELEAVRRAEAALREETQTREAEWRSKLEEAQRREKDWKRKGEKERTEEGERREAEWRTKEAEATQRGAEEERGRCRLQEAEYREQVRQHAHTIVAMEMRLTKTHQSLRGLEEERDSLREQLRELESKLESWSPISPPDPVQSPEREALEQTNTSLRASLAASQQEVVTQGDVIAALSRDLAQAHARVSDMTGELSEQQKMELERHRALVVDQRVELSTLTQRLTMMSQLVKQREQELKGVKENLRQSQEDLEKQKTAERESKELPEHRTQEQADRVLIHTAAHTQDVVPVAVAAADLSEQGSKCKGHRHDEVIWLQQEALSEMRARIRAVEQTWPMKLFAQQGEPVRREQRLAKTQRSQKSTAQKGSVASMCGFALPEVLSEVALERTARLDMSDALDLSERTYLDLARALCEALELSEGQLSGCASLKHLPQGERERLGSLRQTDLGLLRTRLALQHSQAQRRELLLQESHREIHTLRESQAAEQQLQARLDSLRAELQTERQESSLLREALQQSQSLLERERGLSRASKGRKAVSMERVEKRSGRMASHCCVQNESRDKASAKRASLQEKLKKREYEVTTLKQQLGQKDQEPSNMASRLAGCHSNRDVFNQTLSEPALQ